MLTNGHQRSFPSILLRILLLACSVPACTPKISPPRLVLLFMPCTVNRSFLSPYQPSVPYTPNFARLAEQGIVFDRHQTETGQSGPAFASILSGTQATRHGVFRHPTRIHDRVLLIAEAFEQAGFETWFWADHVMASPDLNYGQGVSPARTKWQPGGARRRGAAEGFLKGDDPTFLEILERLANDPELRAFAMTNFTVTHSQYDADALPAFCDSFPARCNILLPRERRRYVELYRKHVFGWMFDFDGTAAQLGLDEVETGRFVMAVELLYAANIHRLDTLLGEVLDAIERAGLSEESLIAVTSDHGEILYRPNAIYAFTHGFALASEVLQVPWLIRGPGLEPQRYEGVTRSIDVLPTLAGLAAVPLPGPAPEGVDLSVALRDGTPARKLLAFSHTALFPNPDISGPMHAHVSPEQMWVAVRDGDRVYKLIPDGVQTRMLVYDWATDWMEMNDLYDPSDPVQRDFEARLKTYKRELVASFHQRARENPEELPFEEQQELLRSLGYIE